MARSITIADVRLRLPSRPEKGVVAWVSCVVCGIKLDSIVVRRVASGDFMLGFPGRHSKLGGKHFYFEPVDREARHALEEAILGKLSGLQSPACAGGHRRHADRDADEGTREHPEDPARDGRRSEP